MLCGAGNHQGFLGLVLQVGERILVKTWIKRVLLAISAVLALLALAAYFYLKSIGIIPSHDYDTEPPTLPAFSKPAVLIFNKTNGFVHKDAIPVAEQVLAELVSANGWEPYVSRNAAVHSPELLAQFDVVIWNNVSGDVLTTDQRQSLKEWIESGGGWLGVHASGGDFSYEWDWYVNTLIGAQFIGHTMKPQFQDADVLVADASLPVTAHLPTPWRVPQEEWYAFGSNPRDKGYEVLLTLDESSYITVGKSFAGVDRMDGEHPIAWRHTLGSGRVVYSAIGHQAATYRISDYQEFLSRAMNWVRGE